MNFNNALNEEWLSSVKNPWGKLADIFMNPSMKEIRELGDSPRIIADSKTKDWFAFNNFLLHSYAAKDIGLINTDKNPRYLCGQVELENEEIKLIEINIFESYEPQEIKLKKYNYIRKFIIEFKKKNWNWLKEKYNINYEDYFKNKVSNFK